MSDNIVMKQTMRNLSDAFMGKLSLKKDRVFAPLVKAVQQDKDLNMELRGFYDPNKLGKAPSNEYINVYFKGNNILKLYRSGVMDIASKFITGCTSMPKSLKNEQDVQTYLSCLPAIKHNVSTLGKASMEIEYEQLLVRANNMEPRNNTEYIIVDRQYAVGRDRWDLIAVKWPRMNRGFEPPKGQLAIIEVKYALNNDISRASGQVERYYRYLSNNIDSICTEIESVLKQKIKLGLINRTPQQINKLNKLSLSRSQDDIEIVLFLIDYNPYSTLVKPAIEELKKLPFSEQVRIIFGGLAMWDKSSKLLNEVTTKSGA
ncbi:hypothetical protein ACFLWX_03665 [Chloroflexota bacterium]